MEKKEFNETYTLKKFCKEELGALLGKDFPYLEIDFGHIPNVIVRANGIGMYLGGVRVKKGEIQISTGCWEVDHNVKAYDIFKEIIRREPTLAYYHMKVEMEKITTMLSYAPGGPGYQEAASEFEELSKS